MNLLTITAVVFGMIIIGHVKSRKEANAKQNPTQKIVEVEIQDEMTKEKISNLYEEQEVCNAKISYLERQNEQHQRDIEVLNSKIQQNIESMRMQLAIQPDADIKVLEAGLDYSNQNIYKSKLKLEGQILSNSEKIVSYKKKSNTISNKINDIGMEIYRKQMRM